MVVVEQVRTLALKLNNPARVTAAIPTAKTCTLRGTELLLVPHKLDEVKVLNNLGISAPSPILHYYNWPGHFKPYEHQRSTAAFITMHQRNLVLNDIGTGKTNSALWAADYLVRANKVGKVLILSPLSTLERVWGDAVFTEFAHRKAIILHGTAKRRVDLLKQDADFYVVNHDGFAIIAPHTIGMFDLVIVDEAAVLRNPTSLRFKVFRKWLDKNPQTRLSLMTGTPTPNSPLDAWALAKLVGSPNLTVSYTAFRDQVMMKVGMWKWEPRPEALEIVKHVLQPAIRFTRDDCLDLPPTVVQTRHAELTPEQKKYYGQMLKHLVTEIASGTVSAANEAVKRQKLLQIVMGVAYGDSQENITIDAGPRIAVVKECIEEAGGKVIVFVPLTGALHMLAAEIAKHWTVEVVNGAVSAKERNRIFSAFQKEASPQVLVAHPGTMAHGLTLTAAATIVWYGPGNSNEVYTQANGRIERIGKTQTSNVIHIESTEIERAMYLRLKNKQTLQGVLLDLIQKT
jgi:SNF2 family DNA or RNA helicase